jgi:hypothetical protein
MSSAPQPPQVPQPQGYTSAQYEFSDENNRTISGLATAMRSFASLMYILGLVFLLFAALTSVAASRADAWHTWGFPVILGAVALLAVMFGFWTGSASGSFRKIVETRNQDVWHLMNALGSLRNMYGTMRVMILVAVILAVIGAVLIAFGLYSAGQVNVPAAT